MRVGCGGCTDVDVVDRTVCCCGCCPAAVLSSDLLFSVREMDDGGADDRCEKGSSSEGCHMLVVSDLV